MLRFSKLGIVLHQFNIHSLLTVKFRNHAEPLCSAAPNLVYNFLDINKNVIAPVKSAFSSAKAEFGS